MCYFPDIFYLNFIFIRLENGVFCKLRKLLSDLCCQAVLSRVENSSLCNKTVSHSEFHSSTPPSRQSCYAGLKPRNPVPLGLVRWFVMPFGIVSRSHSDLPNGSRTSILIVRSFVIPRDDTSGHCKSTNLKRFGFAKLNICPNSKKHAIFLLIHLEIDLINIPPKTLNSVKITLIYQKTKMLILINLTCGTYNKSCIS